MLFSGGKVYFTIEGYKDANRLKFTPDGRVLILAGDAASLVV